MTLRASLDYALGFLNERTPQSMARLCALVFGIVGALLGLAVVGLTVVIAILLWRRVVEPEAIAALAEYLKGAAAVAGALIAAGCVALLTRKKSPDVDRQEES